MKKKDVVVCLMLTLFLASCDEIGNSLRQGETHKGMNYHIAAGIFEEYKQALMRYKAINGTYPINKNYCVPEELKYLLKISATNTCCFLNDCNRSDDLHQNCADWYIAVGDWRSKIIYECTDGLTYRLLYYGYNGMNEDGNGDDIEFLSRE
jgi:hypothetical protein